MLDRRFILQNIDAVRRNAADRNVAVDLDEFLRLEARWRRLNSEQEGLNRESNVLASTRSRPSEEQVEQGRRLKARKAEVEQELRRTERDLADVQSAIPNMTHPAAPVGLTDEDNLELERGRTPLPSFSFAPRDHVELGKPLDLIDFETGSKVAGHGFYFLKNDAVLLDLALQQHSPGPSSRAGLHADRHARPGPQSRLEGIGFTPARRRDADLLDRGHRPRA